jgi:hypothetical protein
LCDKRHQCRESKHLINANRIKCAHPKSTFVKSCGAHHYSLNTVVKNTKHSTLRIYGIDTAQGGYPTAPASGNRICFSGVFDPRNCYLNSPQMRVSREVALQVLRIRRRSAGVIGGQFGSN